MFNAPQTEFVARFIGGHNVMALEGKRFALRSDRTRIGASDQGFDAAVLGFEFLGPQVAVSLMGPGHTDLVAMIPKESFYAAPLDLGATVRVGWDAADLHQLAS